MLFFLKNVSKNPHKQGQPNTNNKKYCGTDELNCVHNRSYLKSYSSLKFKIIPGISDNGFATRTN